jgi:hypothetical protein
MKGLAIAGRVLEHLRTPSSPASSSEVSFLCPFKRLHLLAGKSHSAEFPATICGMILDIFLGLPSTYSNGS